MIDADYADYLALLAKTPVQTEYLHTVLNKSCHLLPISRPSKINKICKELLEN